MTKQLPDEDQRLIDTALALEEIMYQIPAEQMTAWVSGDDAACGVVLMPAMQQAADIMRRLLRGEREQVERHQAALLARGVRCACRLSAAAMTVTWDGDEHEWVLRCECGEITRCEVNHG